MLIIVIFLTCSGMIPYSWAMEEESTPASIQLVHELQNLTEEVKNFLDDLPSYVGYEELKNIQSSWLSLKQLFKQIVEVNKKEILQDHVLKLLVRNAISIVQNVEYALATLEYNSYNQYFAFNVPAGARSL